MQHGRVLRRIQNDPFDLSSRGFDSLSSRFALRYLAATPSMSLAPARSILLSTFDFLPIGTGGEVGDWSDPAQFLVH